MEGSELKSQLAAFEDLPDPRSERNQEHPLLSILLIALCAVISGAENGVDIEGYGKAKQSWRESILELPNGIPSHDTFGRVFRFINPQAFQERFLKWMQSWRGGQRQGGVALRGAKEVPMDKAGLYMVSAWAVEQGIVLGQRKVDDKSNEISALAELLEVLAREGCVVTIEAMGCQTEIAEKIIAREADYLLAVKGNQGTLAEDVTDLFDGFEQAHWHEVTHDYAKTVNKDPARLEIRECWVVSGAASLSYRRRFADWKNLTRLVKVVAHRHPLLYF